MKLYYYCSSCKKENSFKTEATNRFELQKERGDHINERCTNCGTITKRRINRVHAKANMIYILLGGFIGFVAILLVLAFIPIVLVLWLSPAVFAVPFLTWKLQEKRASDFNKIMVSDT